MELFLNEKQSFNSTLVQLKVRNSERSLRNQQSFNSTLVQLKAGRHNKVDKQFLVSILP